MELNELTLEELIELREKVEQAIEKCSEDNSNKYQLELNYNHYKGTGKCWVAHVDKKTKKILKFVNAESNVKNDKYKGYKIFLLRDGYYLSCETGTKSNDKRQYFEIVNGEYIEESE